MPRIRAEVSQNQPASGLLPSVDVSTMRFRVSLLALLLALAGPRNFIRLRPAAVATRRSSIRFRKMMLRCPRSPSASGNITQPLLGSRPLQRRGGTVYPLRDRPGRRERNPKPHRPTSRELDHPARRRLQPKQPFRHSSQSSVHPSFLRAAGRFRHRSRHRIRCGRCVTPLPLCRRSKGIGRRPPRRLRWEIPALRFFSTHLQRARPSSSPE